MNKNKRTRSNLDIVYTILDFARLILITVVAAMVILVFVARKETISCCGVVIERAQHRAFVDGNLMELNAKEFELLTLLVSNAGKTLRKEYIFASIWGMDSFSEQQTLTVHIKMLRDKIEKNPKQPQRIKTVWGVGYRFEEV